MGAARGLRALAGDLGTCRHRVSEATSPAQPPESPGTPQKPPETEAKSRVGGKGESFLGGMGVCGSQKMEAAQAADQPPSPRPLSTRTPASPLTQRALSRGSSCLITMPACPAPA